ncbi:MAG: transposase [Romboutsia sp.]|nr:transposase [Romboutsia sp.]
MKIKKSKDDEKSKNIYKTQSILIKKGHPLYEYFDDIMHKSNNLYNATLFRFRQVYTGFKSSTKLHPLQIEIIEEINNSIPLINKKIKESYEKNVAIQKDKILEYKKLDENKDLKDEEIIKKYKLKKYKLNEYKQLTKENSYLSYSLLDNVYKHTKNIDYRALPAHVNQQVMKKVFENIDSFFVSLKDYSQNQSKYSGKPNLPKYKESGSTHEAIFSNQVCEIKKNGTRTLLKFPKTKLTLNLGKYRGFVDGKLVQVRVQKFYDSIKVEVVIDSGKEKPSVNEEITRLMGLDLGVNNLASCVSNVGANALIINGKPLKSINQFYNKEYARLYSSLRVGKKCNEGKFTTKRIESLHKKRHLKIKDYFHKSSARVVKYALENNIQKVIIGKSLDWKKEVEMKKDNKQSFVYIPHSMFIELLEYKLKEKGIQIEVHEESYTSKASFLDNDTIPTYKSETSKKYTFSGKRVSRGLYKTKNKLVLNADINAAANILRKHSNIDINIDRKVLSNIVKINSFNSNNKNSQKINRNTKNSYYVKNKYVNKSVA